MKRFLVWLLCCALMLGFTACDNGQTASLPSSTEPNPIVPPTSSNIPSVSAPSRPDTPSSGRAPSKLDSSISGPSSSLSGSSPEDVYIIPPEQNTDGNPHSGHFGYSRLTPTQKTYYDAMYNAVLAMQTTWIPLGKKEITYKTDVAVVRNALANDHPDIFWLPSYYATAVGTGASGEPQVLIYFAVSAESEPSYLVTRSQADQMVPELEKAVTDITSKVKATNPYDIELQLHDMLCYNTQYSADLTDPMIYSAYGALVNGRALCEGYSRAMQLLLGEFGIRSVPVTGIAGNEGHMWNAVNIYDEWYHLDVTWNDTKGELSHEYFNLSDEAISLDHSFSKNHVDVAAEELESGMASFNIYRPVCEGTEYNYFNHSGFVLFSDGFDALANYLTRQSDTMVEVRFSDTALRDAVYEKPDTCIQRINQILFTDYPDCGFTVVGISVSASVLRLYKQ